MRKPALCTVTLAALVLSCSECLAAQAASSHTPSSSTSPVVHRVRSEDASISALISEAAQRSTSFREFLDVIDKTDGLVYVERGRCRHGGPACTSPAVKLVGPYRMLRVVVDPRRADCDVDLMASIGHELWHTIEILRDPTIRSFKDIYYLYAPDAVHSERGSSFAWETPAAIRAGSKVFEELKASDAECRK